MHFKKLLRVGMGIGLAAGLAAGMGQLAAADSAPVPKKKAAAAPSKDGKPAEPKEGPVTLELLHSEVEPPEGFDVSVFATAEQANYPVYVAAAPDGTVYVASDGNASMGTDPGRGRILRLRDTNDDGRADEVKVFAKVDSPRGLVWDGDRLYLMHPPHLSVLFDRDGDGVSEEQKVLVKNVGWGLKDRPADHASNGVTLGIDGWLYLAIGDFGFMDAEGTDGRKLTFRGGGVVRVRTDGTGLELFSSGTRNIVEVAVGPLLEMVARDNTNDGDGWDVRLHQFTGLEDHGYPTLYRNFKDEAVPPLADYGGGSGCGAQWVDEPGIPQKWRGAMTVDWGRESVFHHGLTRKGAAFEVTQERFVKLPRATDLDVDARSRVYVSSWRSGRFTYAGPEIGYIARLAPKGYVAPAVPEFAKLSPAELVKLFTSPSARVRMEAQRTLLRRGVRPDRGALETLAKDTAQPLATRVLAVFTLKQAFGEAAHGFLEKLASDSSIAAWAVRALTDHEAQVGRVALEPIVAALRANDARTQVEAMVALARLGKTEHAAALVKFLGSDDPVLAHTAVKAMVRLRAIDAALDVVDVTDVSAARRRDALRVLQAIHEEPVVDALIARLEKEKDATRREGLIRALARLYYVEGKWSGGGWGTRPDTRGPYYQPEKWAASDKINTVLGKLLEGANGAEAAKLNEIFSLHRVTPGDMVAKLLALAETDESVWPTLTEQLVANDSVPAAALPVLVRAARPLQAAGEGKAKAKGPQPGPAQVNACLAMIKLGTPEAIRAVLAALPQVPKNGSRGDAASDRVSNALFLSPSLEKHYTVVAAEAAKLDGLKSAWADAALLQLANRKFGAAAAREAAAKAIDEGWKTPARRAQIIRGAMLGREASRALAIVAALHDPEPAVAEAANAAVRGLKLDPAAVRAEGAANEPVIATLKVEDVLDQVVARRGDRARGEQVYMQAGCVACHTANASEPLRGPYLGNISTLYRRRELAEAIVEPNKTIAQGFVTHQFTMHNGSTRLGFVTREGADVVAVRDVTGAAQEIRLSEVAKREHLKDSLMPPGLMSGFTVRDFAGLLDYLEGLGGK